MNCPFCNQILYSTIEVNTYMSYNCKNHPISTDLFTCDNVFTDCYLGDEELYIQYYFINNVAHFYNDIYSIGPKLIHRQIIPDLMPENAQYWLDRISNMKSFL